jgi:predicted PurR-regulated permease PerM
MHEKSLGQSKSTSKFWQKLDNSALLRFLLFFACGWASVQLISYFYSVLAIFTTAAIVALLLNFPVRALSRYMPRSLAIVITLLATLGILVTFVSLLGLKIVTQGQGLASHISTRLSSEDLLPLKDFLSKVNLEQLFQTLQRGLVSGLGIAQGIFSSVFLSVFTAVIAVYMLIDGRQVWSTCLRLVPADIRDRFDTTFQSSFLGFLQGQFLLIICLSTASFLVFSLLGVQYSLILALIVGILDAIPGIGATLGVFTIVMLVPGSQGVGMALKVPIASLILQQIQDNMVQPKVMGNALKINPVFLFFALFVGERIAGLLGVFLSIPLSGMMAAWLQADAVAAKSADSVSDATTDSTEG